MERVQREDVGERSVLGFIAAFFSVFLLSAFSDLLHCFGCMTVLCGSSIFGVRFVTLAWVLHMMTWQ